MTASSAPELEPSDDFSARLLRSPAGRVDVIVSGTVDILTYDELAAVVDGAWMQAPTRLVLDLRRVTFFSLSSLRLVATTQDRARDQHVPLDILTRGDVIQRLLTYLEDIR